MRLRVLGMAMAIAVGVTAAFAIPLAFIAASAVANRQEQGAIDQADSVAVFLRNTSPSDEQVTNYLASLVRTTGRPTSVTRNDGEVIGSLPFQLAGAGQPIQGGAGPAPGGNGGAPPGRPGGEAGPAAAISSRHVKGGTVFSVLSGGPREDLVQVYLSDGMRRSGLGGWYALIGGASAGVLIVSAVLGELVTRRIVKPLETSAQRGEKLLRGERADPLNFTTGPKEVRILASTVNRLGERIESLWRQDEDRRSELSHRLRTPLAALQLAIDECVDDPASATQLRDHIRQANAALSDFTRGPAASEASSALLPVSDVGRVVRERAMYWEALAEDEERRLEVEILDENLRVPLDPASLEAVIDRLVDNVFNHTPFGTEMKLIAGGTSDEVSVSIDDSGPLGSIDDIPSPGDRPDRSTSAPGLYTVKRAAELAGGRLVLAISPDLGGLRASIVLPRL